MVFRSCIANRSVTRSWWQIRAVILRQRFWHLPRCSRLGVISPQGIIIDAKSGISGAGRSPKPNLHFPECNENLTPYNVGKHRHTPEIDQILSTWANVENQCRIHPASDSDGSRRIDYRLCRRENGHHWR